MPSRKDSAEEEALFRSYPYALYFVQSPSTASRPNSGELPSDTAPASAAAAAVDPSTRLALSRYSSSRGSTNSFLHHHDNKKIVPYDLQSHKTGATENDHPDTNSRRLIGPRDASRVGCDNDEDDDSGDDDGRDDGYEDDGYYGKRKGGFWRYFSFGYSSSCVWIALQIAWRLLVSLGAALLVFYIATKPPPPVVSVKISGIRQFGLGEGVDGSGVSTKMLTLNCSVILRIDNNSKLFGLHIRPPIVTLSYANLPLAASLGPKLFAESHGATSFKLYVGTRDKPTYGAGRSMADALESGNGLALVVRVSLRSSFHVVWSLIRPRFHHQAQCLLLLGTEYDSRHRTQSFRSRCSLVSSF